MSERDRQRWLRVVPALSRRPWIAWVGALALLSVATGVSVVAAQQLPVAVAALLGFVASLASLLAQLALGPTERTRRPRAWNPRRSPYPGLEPFAEEDTWVYFGRDAEVTELLDRVQPWGRAAEKFVAVVGPSGCGKSSLV